MSEVSREQIEAVLAEVEDRYLGTDLISAGVVKNIEINGSEADIKIRQGYPAKGYEDELKDVQFQRKLAKSRGLKVVISISVIKSRPTACRKLPKAWQILKIPLPWLQARAV